MQWDDQLISLDDEPSLRRYRQHLLKELRVYEAAVEHFLNAEERSQVILNDDNDLDAERASRRAAATINYVNTLVRRLEEVTLALDAFDHVLDDDDTPAEPE